MNLTVREAAVFLGVPTNTLYRWLAANRLPAARVRDEVRINRTDLFEWAMSNGTPLVGDLFADPDEAVFDDAPLTEALARGRATSLAGGHIGPEIAVELEEGLPEIVGPGREFVFGPIRQGKVLGHLVLSGPGIAVPRARRPVLIQSNSPIVRIFHPNQVTGDQGIKAWIWILSPTPREHLHLLSRLGRALFEPGLADLLSSQRPIEDILANTMAAEHRMNERPGFDDDSEHT